VHSTGVRNIIVATLAQPDLRQNRFTSGEDSIMHMFALDLIEGQKQSHDEQPQQCRCSTFSCAAAAR
jgi:hypothetical protein